MWHNTALLLASQFWGCDPLELQEQPSVWVRAALWAMQCELDWQAPESQRVIAAANRDAPPGGSETE